MDLQALQAAKSAQNCVGKTIREVKEWSYVSEIIFTDDTKLRIEPESHGGATATVPELIFCDDLSAD